MTEIDHDSTLYAYRPLPRGWMILGLALAGWVVVAAAGLVLWALVA